jgi:hypothetical protein
MRTRYRLPLAFLCLTGLALPMARADEQKKDTRPVEVEIWVIRATTQNDDVTKELRGLAKLLKKQFKYTGFKLEKKHAKKGLELEKAFKADLLADLRVEVKPTGREGRKIAMEVTIFKKADKSKDKKAKDKVVLKTKIKAKAGPFIPYGLGPLENGDFQIMALRAR